MEVCKELIKLAKEVRTKKATLYIVGGYVRDSILGLSNSDIDITSSLSQEDLLAICSKLKIKTHNINKHLGTLQLVFNDIKFEYTRFRQESYLKRGTHTPDKVEFVDDINIDCLRRDFSINSIYYDILADKFIDPVNGIHDIKKKIIRTTNQPNITLQDDGVRILRAIRFAHLLGFKIEKNTMRNLRIYAPLLKEISKERILKELSQLVVADLKYNKDSKHLLKYLNKLSLPSYIFNSSLNRMRKFSRKDKLAFYSLNMDARLMGLYILILKNYFKGYSPDNQLSYTINMLLGINGIKESNDSIITCEKLYRIYQNLQFNLDHINASVNYLTLSDTERSIVDAMLSSKAKNLLYDKISFIKSKNLPLNIHQLDITAQDLIDANIERVYISKILSTLYNQVLNMYVPNENTSLKALAIELHETFTKISKEIS